MVGRREASYLDLDPGSDDRFDYPRNVTSLESQPELLNNGSGLLDNTTRLVGGAHNTRTVHSHEERIKSAANPQYGSFYSEYDPMTGARTAAILGSLLMMLVFYIVYKAKCHQEWTDEDDYYLQQYKQRQAQKTMRQAPRRSVNYIIDPVCHPDPHILAATANWVKMQPLETAVPDPLPGERRRPRYPLSRMPSISAENINRQMLNFTPFIPNGHGPPPIGEVVQRSCNEYVPNGYLKNVHKDCLQHSEWVESETQQAASHYDPTLLDPGDDLFLEFGSYSRRQSAYTGEPADQDDRDVFIHVEVKPEKPLLQQCSSLDRHNNNHNDNGSLLETNNAFPLDVCTNCMSDKNLGGGGHRYPHPQHHHQRPSMILPPDSDLPLARRPPHRSRSRPRCKQRSMETGSSLGSSSQQQSIDDDSPVFCVSTLPVRDAAPGSLDINDLSSNENSSDQQLASSANARVPVLSYFNNLVNNSTFSTMSTATASSNGSYQSEGPDIPLSDLPSGPPEDTTAVIATEQPKHVVEVTIETALPSSSKSNEEMDTKL